MKSKLMLLLVLAFPLASMAQKQEIRELQRDVATLQDQMRVLQSRVDEKFAALTVLVQQALDNINRVNTNVATLDGATRERLKDQITAPMAGLGTKVDQMASEFGFVRDSMTDLTSRMGKLEQRIVDLGNTVKVMQTPAPPAPGSASPGGQAAGGPPPDVSSSSLYANAMRDKDAANYDLALQQFNDYIRWFGTTEMAPNAQYYIGEIFYNKKSYDDALGAFDMVLEKFPQNNKTLDAMYMKGRTLYQLQRRDEAANAYRDVIRTSPRSELATKAGQQLKAMGLSASVSAPAKKAARRRE